ncbi:type II toxin-antitoxin system RelE family toxin [Candidatus Thiosymbion oneisti]|uniref:type II toxin-antitoxin system RelE family toxin n=1 Tax=Candidatus Thiosymbion oneisti TaxID=589554 RepID=UPI000B7EEFC8|nr:type II toxin-antitoxin system RelE/ParE family toxin [Candidatus Thiosymbion oneisti]
MKVCYRKKFLKQLARLPSGTRAKVEKFVFDELPNAVSIAAIGSIEKMQGYRGFYKVRFGSYRVAIKVEGDTLILQVVMDRKDIYKFFP